MKTWDMTHTARWHSNPCHALRQSGDTVAAHMGRMCLDALRYFPGAEMVLIEAILEHDLPEVFTGDWSPDEKRNIAGLRYALDVVEGIVLAHIGALDLEPITLDRLKFLDRLDAYKWARHVAPDVLAGDGWPEAREWLTRQSWRLGCAHVLAADIP